MDGLFEFLFACIVVIFGGGVAFLLLWKIFDMVRGTIKGKRNEEYEESFDRMARAFIQHKKDTERRLENIEAVISQDDVKPTEDQLEEPSYEHIEIDGRRNKIKNNLDKNRTGGKQKTN